MLVLKFIVPMLSSSAVRVLGPPVPTLMLMTPVEELTRVPLLTSRLEFHVDLMVSRVMVLLLVSPVAEVKVA